MLPRALPLRSSPAGLAAVVVVMVLPIFAQLALARADSRVSRPFDQKTAELRYPLVEIDRPVELRRAVPAKSTVALEPEAQHRSDRLVIKFDDRYRVRLAGDGLREMAGEALPGVAAVAGLPGVDHIERLFRRSEEHLDRDRISGVARSGAALADLNNYYLVYLTADAERAAIAAAWLALDVIEIAYFEGIATEACTDIAPATPDFLDNQNYLEPAPVGVDAFSAWAFHPAGAGVPGFWFIDVERGWNVDHEDFGDVAILNGAPYPSSINHGTAVLGEIVGCDTEFGVTGIANQVTARMVNWNNEPSIASAFDLAASYLDPGEVYLIEIHTGGPGPIPGWVCQCNCGQFGYVPMEWEQANFDAIQTHTANGIIVVEAGGNGGMDLDDPFYNGVFDRTFRDSGAILVGAGTPNAHAPECWTNYGSRVDCQGYGSSVASTGYGNLFNPGDENQWYTSSFSGTSSASPIVTGCAIVVQNLAQQAYGLTLDAITMRGALTLFGTPQGAPLDRSIGVLPDLALIIDAWFRPMVAHTPLPDTTNEIDDYEVNAVVTPALLNGGIQSVAIHYSVSGGAYQSVAMSPGGGANQWLGHIPAQDAGSYVLYYLEAIPLAGPEIYYPTGAETAPLEFIVGYMVPVVVDDIEAPSGWVVGAPDDDASSGIWVRDDPHGTYIGASLVAPEEDHTTPGAMAFVTGNPGPGAAPTDGDVDDGKTTLFSPLFDLSGEVYVRISAWVWTRFMFDDVLRIDISNDAGQSWLTLDELDDDIEDWRQVEYELRQDQLAFSDQMQLRCVASDYAVPTLVECGIDDLVIAGLAHQSQAVEAATSPAPPARVFLGPATPNPYRTSTATSTRIRYTLPAAGEVRLTVYDVAGRLVRALVRGEQPAGTHEVGWDGRHRDGRQVAPGVYYLQLEAAGERRSGAVVMLR